MKPIHQNPKPNDFNKIQTEPSSINVFDELEWQPVSVTYSEWIYWHEQGTEIIFFFEELKKDPNFQSMLVTGLRITKMEKLPKKIIFYGHPARFLTPTDLFMKLQNVSPKSILRIRYLRDTNTNKGQMKIFDVQRYVPQTIYEIVKTEFVPDIPEDVPEPF